MEPTAANATIYLLKNLYSCLDYPEVDIITVQHKIDHRTSDEWNTLLEMARECIIDRY